MSEEANLNDSVMGDLTVNDDSPTNAVTDPPKYKDQFSDDLKGNKFFDQFPTISDLGRKTLELDGIAANSIQIPGDDATDEDRNAFNEKAYKLLGKPEKPEGYDIGDLKLPEGVPFTDTQKGELQSFFHKNHYTQAQVNSALELYNNQQTTIDAFMAKTNNDSVDAIKKEWGDQYKGNAEKAFRAVEKFGGEEAKSFFEETVIDGLKLGNHPTMLRMLLAVGNGISEDVAGDIQGGKTPPTDFKKDGFGNTKFEFPNSPGMYD